MNGIPIAKIDVEKQLVFGWASVAAMNGETVTDLQGDQIEPGNLEDVVYAFNRGPRQFNTMHQGPATGELVESLAITEEKLAAMGLPRNSLPQGWWVGAYISDPATFERVKRGELNMFSIEGVGTREDV
jgi:hypothetical protein